jgi:hypothetical protein
MVKGMINELPLALWNEEINTAVYMKNRIPHKAVKESTPYEVIHDNEPPIHHLQPFSRKCFVHIPEEKRPSGSKLLPRAVEGKFIGYSNSNSIFCIYIIFPFSIESSNDKTPQVCFTQLDSGEVTPTTKSNPEYASIPAPLSRRFSHQHHPSKDNSDSESLSADNQLQREAELEGHEQPELEPLDTIERGSETFR